MRLPSLVVTSDAPMCWVMPPRSPAATVVERMASQQVLAVVDVAIWARGDEILLGVLLEQDLLGRLGRVAFSSSSSSLPPTLGSATS